MLKNVCIVIPAYNECATISSIIKQAKSYSDSIIVIDDGSCDNTYDLAKQHKIIVLKHIVNSGKGCALKTGITAAMQLNPEIIITLDADGQHDPADIPKLISVLDSQNLDFVIGARGFDSNMPAILRLGNIGLSKISNLLFGIKARDIQSGFRAYRTSALKKLCWESSGYAVETETLVQAEKKKLRYAEVPIKTIYLDRYKGTCVLDGLKFLGSMILWRLAK